MKLSTRSRYGMRALLYIAERSAEGPISLSAIAEEEGISLHYLEQLMRKLRLSGLVSSVRGAKGGYTLSRSAEEISVGDILRSLEGSLHLTDCLVDEVCDRGEDCPTRQLWNKINEGMTEIVDNTMLADISCKKEETV